MEKQKRRVLQEESMKNRLEDEKDEQRRVIVELHNKLEMKDKRIRGLEGELGECQTHIH